MDDLTWQSCSIYLLLHILYLYTIDMFFNSFLGDKRSNCNKACKVIYILYYITLNISFLIIHINLLQLFINMIFMFAICFLYPNILLHKMYAFVVFYILMMGVEAIVPFMSSMFLGKPLNTLFKGEIYLYLVAMSRLVMLCLIKLTQPIIGRMKKRVEAKLPPYFWMAILSVPVASIFILHIFCKVVYDKNDIQSLASTVLIILVVLINFITFFIYDRLAESYNAKMENALLIQQNRYYIDYYQKLEKSNSEEFEIKHNIKNKLLGVLSTIESGTEDGYQEAIEQLQQMIGLYKNISLKVHCKIAIIDAILNYKLSLAKEFNIEILPNIVVSPNYPVDSQALCVILGNVLDNAIDACKQLTNQPRIIRVWIAEKQHNLYIKVENPYEGQLCFKDGLPVTTKNTGEGHGLGLRSVKQIIDGLDGHFTIDTSNSIFQFEVILFQKPPQ